MANGEVMELMRTRLREAREAQGLTQKDLAEIIGAGKGVVMALENTTLMRAVNLDALCDVCDALDISIDWLFGQTTNKQGFQPGEVHLLQLRHEFDPCFVASIRHCVHLL